MSQQEEHVQGVCENHCGHSLDWMRYDEDFEAVRCAHPVGYACDYCGGLECGHQCSKTSKQAETFELEVEG